MKIIGFKKNNFTGNDGKEVSGVNIYMIYPLVNGNGNGCERMYFSDLRLKNNNYAPAIGDEVEITYNRYGKPETIRKK